MKKYLSLIVLLVALVMVAAQCGSVSNQESAAPAVEESNGPKIMVMEAWSRPSPMMAGNGVIYMTLMNNGNNDDVLLGLETDVAETVELHETKMENDVMKMSPIANIQVPAGGSATLEPGGMHVMLINLKQELVAGEKVAFTLNFEKSGPMVVEAEIHEMGEAAADHAMDDNMGHDMAESDSN